MHSVASTHIILQSAHQKEGRFHNSTKHLIFQSICLGFLALLMSACTVSTAVDTRTLQSALVTDSVANTAKAEGVDEGDTKVINSLVAETDKTPTTEKLLAWQNPDTGNSGTILAIDKFVGPKGRSCKKFQTTVDSFIGISIYDGETCELRKGIWVLSRFFRKKISS